MSTAAIRDWYAARAPREQRILLIGAAAAALILLLWVLLPLQRGLTDARAQLRGRQEDLAWMERVGPTLAAAGPGAAATASTEPLLVVVDRSARESGLAKALTGSQPGADGALRVTLQAADFNLLLGWLARLSSQHGVRVEAASFTATGKPGEVNAQLQLRSRS